MIEARVAPHLVQVDQHAGAARAAAGQVELARAAELLPADELPHHLRHDLRAEEGEPLSGAGVGPRRAGPGVAAAVGHQHVVGGGEVRVLLLVTGEDPAHCLHLGPPADSHHY